MELLVECDLLCERCGFKLVTRSLDARCPECGTPVSGSLSIPGFRIGSRRTAGRIQAAIGIIVLAVLLRAAIVDCLVTLYTDYYSYSRAFWRSAYRFDGTSMDATKAIMGLGVLVLIASSVEVPGVIRRWVAILILFMTAAIVAGDAASWWINPAPGYSLEDLRVLWLTASLWTCRCCHPVLIPLSLVLLRRLINPVAMPWTRRLLRFCTMISGFFVLQAMADVIASVVMFSGTREGRGFSPAVVCGNVPEWLSNVNRWFDEAERDVGAACWILVLIAIGVFLRQLQKAMRS